MPEKYLFTTTYDFSDFTESELSEIRRSYGSLYNYALIQIQEERENLFKQARIYDIRYNYEVIAKHDDAYSRYACLEDALRHLVNGVVKIDFSKDITIYNDSGRYVLKHITPKERIYITDKTDKYSQEYLRWLYNNKLTLPIRKWWYNGSEDKNIKTDKEDNKETCREEACNQKRS